MSEGTLSTVKPILSDAYRNSNCEATKNAKNVQNAKKISRTPSCSLCLSWFGFLRFCHVVAKTLVVVAVWMALVPIPGGFDDRVQVAELRVPA